MKTFLVVWEKNSSTSIMIINSDNMITAKFIASENGFGGNFEIKELNIEQKGVVFKEQFII